MMASLPLLIVIVCALVATGLTAAGLRVFFRILDSASESASAGAPEATARESIPGGE